MGDPVIGGLQRGKKDILPFIGMSMSYRIVGEVLGDQLAYAVYFMMMMSRSQQENKK